MKIINAPMFKNIGARPLRVGDECRYRPPYHSETLAGRVSSVSRDGYSVAFDGFGDVFFPDFDSNTRGARLKRRAWGGGEFICICREEFSERVWHCPVCAHHWPPAITSCKNCHNYSRRHHPAFWAKPRRSNRKRMTTTHDHTQLVNETRLALGLESDFTLWLNAKVTYVDGQPRAKPGLGKGSTDLIGILNSPLDRGRFVALEAKTGDAKPTKEQIMFMELVRKRGGFAAIFHSVEEAKQALQRAREGKSE